MHGYRHYAGCVGSKTLWVGKDASVYNYTCIQEAVDAAQNNDIIMIEPGIYTLTSPLSIVKPLTLIGMRYCGDFGVKITCATAMADAVVKIEPVVCAATCEIGFENILFTTGVDNDNVIEVNNTTVAQNLKLRFVGCSIEVFDAASTGRGISVSHADATKNIQVHVAGWGWQKLQAAYFTAKNATDALHVYRMKCDACAQTAALESSADNIGFNFSMWYSQFTHNKATSGGHVTQSARSFFSFTDDGAGAFAAIDGNDLIGAHTEIIVA